MTMRTRSTRSWIGRGIGVLAAVATAVALSPAGTAVADGSAEAGPNTLGPKGYKSLRLGLSESEAKATGLITDRQQIGDCAWFYLKRSEGQQNPGSGVVISPTRGVVSIPGTQKTRTPEDIRMGSIDNHKGSPVEKIENSYDRYTVDKTGPVPTYTAPTPGNGKAHYLFAIGDDGKVKDMVLTANNDGECGLND